VLLSTPGTIAILKNPREITYLFPPQPPKPPPAAIPVPSPPSQVRVPVFRTAPWPQAPITAPPGNNGLNLSLFDCAPERLATLTPEQRAHCHSTLTLGSVTGSIPGGVKELSLDPGRWRAAIAARNTPLTVPCTHTENILVGLAPPRTSPTVMTDPLCAIRKVLGADK
jgi:hypothetical protein